MSRLASIRGRRSVNFGALALAAWAMAACGGPAVTAAPPPDGAIVVEAKEYEFTPSTLTTTAGEVRLYVHNAGATEHEFDLYRGEQVLSELKGLVPGAAKDLAITLAPGEYTYVCKLSGHDQLGMHGVLTVTGP